MKLEKIMTKENLLKKGFREINSEGKNIMYRCKKENDIIYFQLKDNLYQRARKLG